MQRLSGAINLSRIRRFAWCLFFNGTEADGAVCRALEAAIGNRGAVGAGGPRAVEHCLFQSILNDARIYFQHGTRSTEFDRFPCAPTKRRPAPVAAQALASLSFDERAEIVLHVLEGYGVEDTAVMMHLPKNSVIDGLRTARTRLMSNIMADLA